jgi:hypothetical protein
MANELLPPDERIRRVRDALNWRIGDIAIWFGVSHPTAAGWVTGARPVPETQLDRVKALEMATLMYLRDVSMANDAPALGAPPRPGDTPPAGSKAGHLLALGAAAGLFWLLTQKDDE